MKILQGQDYSLPFFAQNSSGGIVDLTGAAIMFSVKSSLDNGVYDLQEKNTAAGGSDVQIKTIDATRGIFIVNIARVDTLLWDSDLYWFDYVIQVGTNNYVHSESFKLIKTVNKDGTDMTIRRSGTTAQRDRKSVV